MPSDLPPLGASRYSDTAYRQQQPLRVAPSNIMATPNLPDSGETARIEVVGGQPVVFIGDRMFTLPAVSTTSSTLPLNGIAAMDPAMKRGSEPPTPGFQGAVPGNYGSQSRSATDAALAGVDLTTLKTRQAYKKQELRSVEQTEVLEASHQTPAWRAALVEKKRSLIVELDVLRKQILALETGVTTSKLTSLPNAVSGSTTPMPSFGVQSQPPFAPAMYPLPAANQFAPMPMYHPQPQVYGGFSSFAAVEPAAFVPSPIAPQATHSSPGSATRRSCAIEIKPPPPEEVKKPLALNPKSPTYEPAAKSNDVQKPPTPSPDKSSACHAQEASVSVKHENGTLSRNHSLSSVDTTDFFPTNTHEHSSTRVAPQINEPKESAAPTAASTTSEKTWPASPWNEGQTAHYGKLDVAPKLTSWPEAFGKKLSQQSLRPSTATQSLLATSGQNSQQSLRPNTANQSLSATSGQNSAVGTMLTTSLTASSRSSNPATRTNSAKHNGAYQSWMLSEKPAAHVPSTWQEGYQAGYDHVGIPDTPEVLQGFIQGLLHFLTDEQKKRQAEYQRRASAGTPSLKGLVAESQPHDYVFGVGTYRNGLNSDQENFRLTKTSPSDDGCRSIGYGAQHFRSPSMFPPGMASQPGQAVVSNNQYGASKGMMHNQGSTLNGDSHLNGETAQPHLGTQMQKRGQGTPLSMQCLSTTVKEQGSHELGGYVKPPRRTFADLRLTGLDGAMDDLAEMIADAHIDEAHTSVLAEKQSPEVKVADAKVLVEYEESDASCFKSSSNKGKQKATSFPAKRTETERETMAVSCTNTPGSPKKSGEHSPKKAGEHSPAKAKLEQVTNKFRRGKKDDGRTMSPDERTKRSEKWRQRFQQLKRTELEEIEAYRKDSGT